MRRIVFTALVLLAPTALYAQEQQTSQQNHSGQRNSLPAATAEPENAREYAPPTPMERQGPTAEDRGPAQRPFILASEPDQLDQLDDPPRVGNLPPENVALDRRVRVSLIHDVDTGSAYKVGENHALAFEITYIKWGAVTAEQLRAREGHYFTISWGNHGPPADFTAVFQYRQVKSKEIVRTLVQNMPHVHGTVRSYFGVVGNAYLAYGPVASWRLTIHRGNQVVAESQSYVW